MFTIFEDVIRLKALLLVHLSGIRDLDLASLLVQVWYICKYGQHFCLHLLSCTSRGIVTLTFVLDFVQSKLQVHVLLSSSNTVRCPQHVQSALVRAVFAAFWSSNPDRILKSLHWFKVHECIEYKVISTTYKLL